MDKIDILNLQINNITMSELLEELGGGGTVFTPNVDHLIKLQRNKKFRQVYKKADYQVCDSKILYIASRILGKPIREKISGSDLLPAFYERYQSDETVKIFLLGAPEGVAQTAQIKINAKVGRQIVVGTYCPPFGFEKDEQECEKIINLINNSGATVLAVGVGAPKQEMWIAQHKKQLKNIKVFLAVGATIEFEAGYRKRAPKWVSNIGLEWLYRLWGEPKRLWKRYLLDDMPFFWFLFRETLRFSLEPRVRKKKLRVAMLGPSLAEKGGMGSVSSLILDTAPDDVKIKHISTWDGDKSKASKFQMLQAWLRSILSLQCNLLRGKVDLVHIHLAERGSALRKSVLILIALAFRKPIILHAHGCEFHLFHSQLPSFFKYGLNLILQRCDRMIVLSESWRKFYINYCGLSPQQVVVLPNPVVIPATVLRHVNPEKLNLVFLGKINQRKGIFDLIQAFAALPQHLRAKAQLTLAGSGEVESARQLAESLQIEQQVVFPGWINSKQRNELLATADVFLLPSYNEGLPMALLEAMSWGLPAITTPVGGIPEVVQDHENGLLVEPGNIPQLTAAMHSLLENTDLRLQIGKNARAEVLPLDVNQYMSSLVKLYDCVTLKNTEVERLRNRLEEEAQMRQQLSSQVSSLQLQLEQQQQILERTLSQVEALKGTMKVA